MNTLELDQIRRLLDTKSGSWLEQSEAIYRKHLDSQGMFFPNSSILPTLLPKGLKPRLAKLAKTLHRALNIEAAIFFRSHNLQGITLPSVFADYITHAEGIDSHPFFRVDLFTGPTFEDLRILELNCSDPSGMGYNELMVQGYLENPDMVKFAQLHETGFTFLAPKYVDALLRCYNEHCVHQLIEATEKPQFILLIPESTFVYSDFVYLRNAIRLAGYSAEIVAPKDYKYDPSKTDTLYIRDSLWDFIDETGTVQSADAIKLVRDPRLFCMNPTSSYFGEQKTVLSLLQKHCSEIIPTRILENASESELGEIQRNKDRYVLKPADAYGGHGVVLGLDATSIQWTEALQTAMALKKPYVIQDYVPADLSPLHKIEGGQLVCHSVATCLSFWVFRGEFAGAFARKSSQNVINVHQGGALVPALFV